MDKDFRQAMHWNRRAPVITVAPEKGSFTEKTEKRDVSVREKARVWAPRRPSPPIGTRPGQPLQESLPENAYSRDGTLALYQPSPMVVKEQPVERIDTPEEIFSPHAPLSVSVTEDNPAEEVTFTEITGTGEIMALNAPEEGPVPEELPEKEDDRDVPPDTDSVTGEEKEDEAEEDETEQIEIKEAENALMDAPEDDEEALEETWIADEEVALAESLMPEEEAGMANAEEVHAGQEGALFPSGEGDTETGVTDTHEEIETFSDEQGDDDILGEGLPTDFVPKAWPNESTEEEQQAAAEDVDFEVTLSEENAFEDAINTILTEAFIADTAETLAREQQAAREESAKDEVDMLQELEDAQPEIHTGMPADLHDRVEDALEKVGMAMAEFDEALAEDIIRDALSDVADDAGEAMMEEAPVVVDALVNTHFAADGTAGEEVELEEAVSEENAFEDDVEEALEETLIAGEEEAALAENAIPEEDTVIAETEETSLPADTGFGQETTEPVSLEEEKLHLEDIIIKMTDADNALQEAEIPVLNDGLPDEEFTAGIVQEAGLEEAVSEENAFGDGAGDTQEEVRLTDAEKDVNPENAMFPDGELPAVAEETIPAEEEAVFPAAETKEPEGQPAGEEETYPPFEVIDEDDASDADFRNEEDLPADWNAQEVTFIEVQDGMPAGQPLTGETNAAENREENTGEKPVAESAKEEEKEADNMPPAMAIPVLDNPVQPEEKQLLPSLDPSRLPVLTQEIDPMLPESEEGLFRAKMWNHRRKKLACMEFKVAVAYSHPGIEENRAEIIKWYKRAAENGHAISQFNLGNIYYEGRGVERDYKEAADWYQLAAEKGIARAQDNLGLMYFHGRGVECDPDMAAYWYRKAAEQDYAPAQYKLALFLEAGIGVDEPDIAEAIEMYMRAAEQGHRQAMKELSRLDKA